MWEIKIDHGPGYRVYFGKIEDKIIILLSAGSKTNQSQDISKAKEYWLDYKENIHGKNIKLPRRINKKTQRPRA